MYRILLILILAVSLFSCEEFKPSELNNNTAKQEQSRVEQNQSKLNSIQPSPQVTWSLERDNLIKRFKLMNDRAVVFYMYVYNYGVAEPIGYYQINKVSSVNSQLTNPRQIVLTDQYDLGNELRYGRSAHVLDSPAEDGSYGTNGNGVFGFTPDEIYIEHNMQYILATVPLKLNAPQIALINVETANELKSLMKRINN